MLLLLILSVTEWLGWVGLHENAAILRNENDTDQFLAGVLATQPQIDIGQVTGLYIYIIYKIYLSYSLGTIGCH